MKTSKLNNNIAQTAAIPTPPKGRFAVAAPKLAFAAALSMYVASSQAQFGLPAVFLGTTFLPPAPSDGLMVDFRCDDLADCPVDTYGGTPLPFTDSTGDTDYLAAFDFVGSTECYGGKFVTNTDEGVGVRCDAPFEGITAIPVDAPIEQGETLRIDFCEDDTEEAYGGPGSCFPDTGTPMLGIYLTSLTSENSQYGGFCESEEGSLAISFADNPGTEIYSWSSNNAGEGGEGNQGNCIDLDDQTVLLVWDTDARPVTSIEVRKDSFVGDGIFVAGIEDCGGGTFDTSSRQCEVELIPPAAQFPDGGDLRVTADPLAIVTVAPDFPVRLLDDRAACQADANGNEPLVDLEVWNKTAYKLDGTPISLSLPIDNEDPQLATQFVKFSKKGCGTPRMTPNGPPVERGTENSMPYIDVVALAADVDPVASTTRFASSGLDGTLYACQAANVFNGTADLDQPFFEINARADEIKYLRGFANPGTLDAVGRDVMVGCGSSKRAATRRYSYLGWNVIHAEGVDLRAETDDEIAVLVETAQRARACVSTQNYYRYLAGDPRRIDRYYDVAVRAAELGRTSLAYSYFNFTANAIENYRYRLLYDGAARTALTGCYSQAPNYVALTTAAAGNKPANVYGDLLSQLEHLEYVVRAFTDLLADD